MSRIRFKKCIDCGGKIEKSDLRLRCKNCFNKIKVLDENESDRSKNICTECGNIFSKDPHSRDYHCPECKGKVEFRKTHTCCSRCKQLKHRNEFPDGNTTVCNECRRKEAVEKEINQKQKELAEKDKIYLRKCKICRIEVKTTSKCATVILCDDCKKDREDRRKLEADPEWRKEQRKDIVYIRQCLDCKKDVVVDKPRATVIYCKECKNKKLEAIRQRKLERINRDFHRTCQFCGTVEIIDKTKPRTDYHYICTKCVEKPNYLKTYIRHCTTCGKEIIVNDNYITVINCNDCKNLTDEDKLKIKNSRPIVFKIENEPITFARRANYYGYQGIASDGHKFWSLNEQDLEEWLFARNIDHICLPKYDIYIEMDGLGRKDDVDWYGKLSLYEKLGLKYKIIKPVKYHYYENKEKCFEELDAIFKDIIGL